MPQRRTAKKELRKNIKRRQRNLAIKRDIKTAVKKLKTAIENSKSAETKKALNQVYKILDRAASKNVIHRNKAARKKSRLTVLAAKTKKKKA